MPRKLLGLVKRFNIETHKAIELVRAAEEEWFQERGGNGAKIEYIPIHYTRLEHLYELAYLRIFCAWEMFLEDTVSRCLLGFHTKDGKPTRPPGKSFCKTVAHAKKELVGGSGFILWGNVDKALKAIAKNIVNGRHEHIIKGAKARLRHYHIIRNRVAHTNPDAKKKFKATAWALNMRRYKDSCAGRFLRDHDRRPTRNMRWQHSIAKTLQSLARSICG